MNAGKEPHIFAGTHTEIESNKRVVVDGCDGIVDYGDDEVIVKSGRLIITISGRDLRLKILTDSSAVIEGYLSSVHFGY
ncbi:MAG: YabP/YqfC family sporulation protein [Oscillospiraceae bacterium]